MREESMQEFETITDYHRLKYLGNDINEVLSILLKNIKIGVGLFEVGETIRAIYLNEGYFESIGYTVEEYEKYQNNIFEVLFPEDVEGFRNCIKEQVSKHEIIQYTVRGYRKDGTLGIFEIKGVPIENKVSDTPIYLTVISNITDELEKNLRLNELNRINTQLMLQKKRYKILEATAQGLLFEYIPQEDKMVFSYNFPNNKKRKVIENYSQYIKQSPLVHSSHIEKFRKALADACENEIENNLEYLSSVSGGGYRWHLTHYKSLSDENGNIFSVIGRIEDIHEKKMEKEQLNYKADMDGLTNLYRKESAFEKMKEYVHECQNGSFYFIVIDLDDFKQINDQYGHQYGDKVLKHTADELLRLFGETSIIGRFGGDEFVILTKDMPDEEIKRLLELMQKDVKFCAGVTAWKAGEDIKVVFNKADNAMYRIKNADKNGIFFLK